MQSSPNLSSSLPKSDQDNIEKKDQKFEGFYFLRAIFSIAIVGYKTNLFFIPEVLVPGKLSYALSTYVLSGMFGALAVPVFLQISLFIFYHKGLKTWLKYFLQKRLPRLVFLYLFWVSSITIFDIVFFNKFEDIRTQFSGLKTSLEFIVSGNGTPYFFFFSLIFVTIIAEILILVFDKLKKPSSQNTISYCLFFASSMMVFTFATIDPIIQYTGNQSSFLTVLSNITYWDYNPFNFLPYVFTAAITAQEYNQGKLERITKALKCKLSFLFALTIMFFALEWVLTSHKLLIQVEQSSLDHYMRLSLVFGSWFILYLALLSKQKPPAIIKFLSGCSLGIYGFHVFFTKTLHLSITPLSQSLFQDFLGFQIISIFLVVLVGSIALTVCFKKINILNLFV